MHRLHTSFWLGYHGCDVTTAETLLKGAQFKASKNAYDWLGSGIYFWENNPLRALDFARESGIRKTIQEAKACVVGAVIEPGNCLDLTSQSGIEAVRASYNALRSLNTKGTAVLPENKGSRRNLDCAVVNLLHKINEVNKAPPIDTIRALFVEGDPIYEGSGFHSRTHTHICVVNPDCIKAVFRVRKQDIDS